MSGFFCCQFDVIPWDKLSALTRFASKLTRQPFMAQ